ncbi:hypothetical protein OOK13_45160 [Streptomyces sp. NBC_00378]|uniref:hypothetical protein n=1 Tax=Streptomyces sp. NBC_00378 TaxID=2975732 RepID=UPI00225628E1|nr:hypothetical protein [Streptomyces sp. NBC_00378]MCX5115489.1 hypothetical protein [Streptomyces sp. NBC_00378]
MARYDEWLRIYDSAPVSDIDTSTAYRKENCYDGATWGPRLGSTGEHVRIDMTEALLLGRTVDVHDDGAVVIQSPYPAGGLIRYTPIR